MPEDQRYLYSRSEPSIFTEIYFPKRAAYQAAIFNALQAGMDKERVKNYLNDNLEGLLVELQDYPYLFNPHAYEDTSPTVSKEVTLQEARKRIAMYRSPFYGWSLYEVDGFFLGKRKRVYEERTQVVRITFRFQSRFRKRAVSLGYLDVWRAVMTFAMAEYGEVDHWDPWNPSAKERFLARYEPWPEDRRTFTERYFVPIGKEVAKFIDDRALLVFGYLVRNFWKEVIAQGRREEEIWVANIYNVHVNVVKRAVPPLG